MQYALAQSRLTVSVLVLAGLFIGLLLAKQATDGHASVVCNCNDETGADSGAP